MCKGISNDMWKTYLVKLKSFFFFLQMPKNIECVSQRVICQKKKNHSGCPVTQDDFTNVGFTPENKLADNQTDLVWAFQYAL